MHRIDEGDYENGVGEVVTGVMHRINESDDENASIDAQIHRNNRKIKKQT